MPQSYCQVFFDSVFAINFLDIFAIIASGERLHHRDAGKEPGKGNHHDSHYARRADWAATRLPTFAAEHRVTELGRHDAYVVPQGGGFELDAAATKKVLLAEG